MPSGVSFRGYALVSVAVSVLVVLNTWMQYEQFYPTLVALTNSKPALIALVNLAIVISAASGWAVKQFFLGTLRDNEYEHLTDKSYPMILDLLLTVTLFRMSLSVSFFAMLEALIIAKCMHWLVNKRVEYMGQTPMVHYSTYVRLGVFMILLLAVDALVVIKSARTVLNESGGIFGLFSGFGDSNGPSIHILYGFEFAILATMMLGSMVRSALTIWEMVKYLGRWDDKSTFVMYTDFVVDVFQFGIYMVFFLTLYAHVGLPITLVRPLLVAFSNFRKRVADIVRYRQATANMETRFPEATEAELAAAHNLCIICREDMNQGKKLPCGHVLHLRCLREWLEHQQTCPTCRVPVLGERQPQQQAQQQAQQQQQDANNMFRAPNVFGGVGAAQAFMQNMAQQQGQGMGQANGNAGPLPGHLGPFGMMPGANNFFPQMLYAPFPHNQQGFYVPYQAPVAGMQPAVQPPQNPPQSPVQVPTQEGVAQPPSSSTSPSLSTSLFASSSGISSPDTHHQVPADVANDMAELTQSISRDVDLIRSRVDILMALMRQHGIEPLPSPSPSAAASSSTPNTSS